MTSLNDPKWKDACAQVGEMVLLSTALDYQLTGVVIEVMQGGRPTGLMGVATEAYQRYVAHLDVLPDIPTVADSVPGYEASGLRALERPRTPLPT